MHRIESTKKQRKAERAVASSTVAVFEAADRPGGGSGGWE